MFCCNREDIKKQGTDNTVWQVAEIFYISIRSKWEFLIFWVIPGSKLRRLQFKYPGILIRYYITGQQVLFVNTFIRAIIVNGYHAVWYFDKN